jgi:putative membrane protein
MTGMGISAMLMTVLWIVAIGVIVVLVVWVAGRALGGGTGRDKESALELLKKRYARGEISRAEFEEKKRDVR